MYINIKNKNTMKFQNIKIAAFSMLTLFTISCSSDDDSAGEVIDGTFGEVELFFDNSVAGDALILGNTYTNSNGESLTIDRFNYIVSNFVLIRHCLFFGLAFSWADVWD